MLKQALNLTEAVNEELNNNLTNAAHRIVSTNTQDISSSLESTLHGYYVEASQVLEPVNEARATGLCNKIADRYQPSFGINQHQMLNKK